MKTIIRFAVLGFLVLYCHSCQNNKYRDEELYRIMEKVSQGHVIDIVGILSILTAYSITVFKSKSLGVINLFTCHFEIVVLSLCQPDHAPYFLYTGKRYLQ